jgi:hypothetical protein
MNAIPTSTQDPQLAVVLVTPSHGRILRGTLRCLREQTIRDRIEIILVGPEPASFDDLEPAATDGFAATRTVAAGDIVETERALGIGAFAARAPVVALLENHVYPDRDWAAAVLQAHRGPWAAVGSVIDNANPATVTSWVEHLMSYGFHDSSMPGGESARVSRNNLVFKRSVLAAFGERLPDALARDGGLLEEVQRNGARFYREVGARLGHLNVSRLVPMLTLRIYSARARAATRARTEGWEAPKRLLYVLACPAFPLLRLRALLPRLRARSGPPVPGAVWPLLLVTLVFDAFGQAIGFAAGAGRSAARAGHFDLDRHRYLSSADRARFAE